MQIKSNQWLTFWILTSNTKLGHSTPNHTECVTYTLEYIKKQCFTV